MEEFEREVNILREQADRDSILLSEKEKQEKDWQTQKKQLEQLLKNKEQEISSIKQSLNEQSGLEMPEPIELCPVANRLHLIASKGQRASNSDLSALTDYTKQSLPDFHWLFPRFLLFTYITVR